MSYEIQANEEAGTQAELLRLQTRVRELEAELDKAVEMMNHCIREHGEMRMLCANGRYLTERERSLLGILSTRLSQFDRDTVRGLLERMK